MKFQKIISLLIVFLACHISFAQESAFEFFNTSRYARTIRLGNAYTGVAEGPEALYYNTAGIANHKSYSFIFSKGEGLAIFLEGIRAYNYALVVPLKEEYGTIGISLDALSYDFMESESGNDIYSAHYARKFGEDISAGISASYYRSYMSNVRTILNPSSPTTITGTAFDLNLSMLYRMPDQLRISTKDNFNIGFQIKNILDTKIKYDNIFEEDHKFQNVRLGLSYSYAPNLEKLLDLSPIELMLAFDAVFMGAKYEFNNWQPNYGIELTLLEVLQLSFGRENEIQIKETYSYSPQHPVNRYGAGIRIPFQKLFMLAYNLELKIDYSFSDWQKIDEEKGRSKFIALNGPIDREAISARLSVGL